MIKFKTLVILLVISIILIKIFFIKYAYSSSLSQSMNNYLSNIGSGNITKPQFIKGQRANHIALGGLQYRASTEFLQPASVQFPSLNAGCGGIDFFSGGFSFIDSDQLVNFVKKVGANASGVLMQIAIETVTPMISSQMKYFQDLARKVNNFNINSCQLARQMVGGVKSYLDSSAESSCRNIGSNKNRGYFTDGSDAQEKCTSGGRAREVAKQSGEIITEDTNIVWKALTEIGYINPSDPKSVALGEIMMTLTGTVVLKVGSNNNSPQQIIPYYPKIDEDKIITSVLEGGQITKYSCRDKEKCLNITAKKETIEAKNAYKNIISNTISNIIANIKAERSGTITNTNSTTNDNNYKILAFSSLPIASMVNIHASYYSSPTEVSSISEYVAYDILYGYFEHITKIVNMATFKYKKKAQLAIFRQYFEYQNIIRNHIEKKKKSIKDQFNSYNNLLQRTAMIESLVKKDATGSFKFK